MSWVDAAKVHFGKAMAKCDVPPLGNVWLLSDASLTQCRMQLEAWLARLEVAAMPTGGVGSIRNKARSV
jgi:hypothetical protein